MDIFSLIPQFGNLAFTLVAFVVALSVIVAIHEYGHYIIGRLGGIEAEVFSLGFGPVIFSRHDKRGTRWQFALFPLGGYVKFKGDSDAASGKDTDAAATMTEAERRATMHGAPLWARAATVAAGPAFNFVFSLLLFTAMMMVQGVTREPLTVGELVDLPEAAGAELTLQEGDELLAIAGNDIEALNGLGSLEGVPSEAVVEYTVRRDGQEITVLGPHPARPWVSQLAPDSAAWAVEMKPGDVITAIDGEPIVAFQQLKDAVEGSEGRTLLFEIWRDGQTLEFAVQPRAVDEPRPEGGFRTVYRIGISSGPTFQPATETPGIFSALEYGVTQTWAIITGSLSALWHIATGAISSCNLSGPIGIAQASGVMASQGTQSFVYFIAVLSTAVGMINLFPIPVLDGGHLVFHGYEAVTGRPPSDAIMKYLMIAGLSVVLGFMLFALSNDIFC